MTYTDSFYEYCCFYLPIYDQSSIGMSSPAFEYLAGIVPFVVILVLTAKVQCQWGMDDECCNWPICVYFIVIFVA